MACEEIIMAPDVLGSASAGIDETDIGPTIRSAAIGKSAEARRTISPAIALRYARQRVKCAEGRQFRLVCTDYILSTDLDDFKKKHAIQKTEEFVALPRLPIAARRPRFDLRFVELSGRRPPKSRGSRWVCRPSALRADPSLENGWRPVQVPIKSIMSEAFAQQTITAKSKRQIENNNVNFVCIPWKAAGATQTVRFSWQIIWRGWTHARFARWHTSPTMPAAMRLGSRWLATKL